MKNSIGKLILSGVLMVIIAFNSSAAFNNETLRYVVTYKWGVVHKDAGDATLSLRNTGSNYTLRLTGRTKPWADKVFMVRDTLTATVTRNGLKPVRYVKVAHEGGKYAKDVIDYTRSGNHTLGKCSRYRVKKGKRSTAGTNSECHRSYV